MKCVSPSEPRKIAKQCELELWLPPGLSKTVTQSTRETIAVVLDHLLFGDRQPRRELGEKAGQVNTWWGCPGILPIEKHHLGRVSSQQTEVSQIQIPVDQRLGILL